MLLSFFSLKVLDGGWDIMAGKAWRKNMKLTYHMVSVQRQGAKRTRNWTIKAQRLLEPSQVIPPARDQALK